MAQKILTFSAFPSLWRLTDRLSGFIRGRLWLKVLIAMALGCTTGILIGPGISGLEPGTTQLIASWAALPGYLFLALVQMIVIPLVIASIILGMASSENTDQLRRIGSRTVLFFAATTLVAVMVGLLFALTIKPGSFMAPQAIGGLPASQSPAAFSFLELPAQIAGLIPTNPIKAGAEQNMLQIVVLAILVGIALVTMPAKQSRPLLDLLGSVLELSMVVVRWAMLIVPFAVFGLMLRLTTQLGLEALLGVSLYVITVLSGLLTMLVCYLVFYQLGRQRSALAFLRASRDTLLLAFSTSSSAAVMPVTLQTAQERLGVRKAIAQFVIPLGTTINMAGTALYQVVATVFLAQVFNVDLGIAQLLLVVTIAVGASIGSPGTPGIGIVILSMMLATVGIPAEGIALIIGVDRILDMCRTTLNVTGDLVAAGVLDRWLPVEEGEEQQGEAPAPSVNGA